MLPYSLFLLYFGQINDDDDEEDDDDDYENLRHIRPYVVGLVVVNSISCECAGWTICMAEGHSGSRPRFLFLRLRAIPDGLWSDRRAAWCKVGHVCIRQCVDTLNAADSDCRRAWLPSCHRRSNRRRYRFRKFVDFAVIYLSFQLWFLSRGGVGLW